jgi:hypothetical protein
MRLIHASRQGSQYDFRASNLKVCLATRDGEWVKDDDALDDMLRKDAIEDHLRQRTLVRSSCRLNNNACFGGTFASADGDIHVLVQLPRFQVSGTVCGSAKRQKIGFDAHSCVARERSV